MDLRRVHILEALGRNDSFDPETDPLVRMEAGKLRRRLERDYLVAGQSDPVRIEIPNGTYVPTFRWHPDSDLAAAPAPKPKLVARLRSLRGAPMGLFGFGLTLLVLLTIAPWQTKRSAPAAWSCRREWRADRTARRAALPPPACRR
jgi:hypothetical protein